MKEKNQINKDDKAWDGREGPIIVACIAISFLPYILYKIFT